MQSNAVILKQKKTSKNYAQAPPKDCIYCVFEVTAQEGSSAVVSKEREARLSQNYAQASPNK